ncbi:MULTISPECIES: hypothetical protein [unclassified Roseofilum]|nr:MULTISPECIES: hypothetical protein [unclassified Roseofilum]
MVSEISSAYRGLLEQPILTGRGDRRLQQSPKPAIAPYNANSTDL